MNTTSGDRPDPQALLSEIERERHGALKVFLGACPGVGKTYKMLEAAREARREGADIVIGVVESHGRLETETLCEGLESIPLMQLEYRGVQFREMDLDAILKRCPAVVLVDELAHRNIPDTRHPRRYQDIEELLKHGIDVWTTLNIQHLESLNDVVARITGVRMRETVPDAVLDAARDVVLVDLTPRELVERLKQGKVYIPEQARAALDGFFSPPNLAALRELALQAVAERIDRDVREVMRSRGVAGPWPVRARIVAAIDGIGNGEELVRLTSRLAERRRAPWSVVFVDRGDTGPEQRGGVERAFELADQLGGETVTLRGHDPVEELLAFARNQNATTLVVGRSRHRPLAGLFNRTLSQRLLRLGADFEITFVPTRVARVHRRRTTRLFQPIEPAAYYLFALAMVAAATAVAVAIDSLVPLGSLSLVFLTAVLLVAVRTAMRPALVAAVVSAGAYNFFFTEPLYTFAMHRPHELVTVGFFLVIALIGGQLAGRLRNQVLALRSTNEQTQTLLALSRRLAAIVDLATVQREAATAIAEHLRVPVVLLTPRDGGKLELAAGSQDGIDLSEKAWSAAQWAQDHGQPSGFQTDTLSGTDWRFLPLALEQESFGVIGVSRPGQELRSEQLAAIDALVNQVTLVMARTRLSTSLAQAKVVEETERLRSALLSSVSHDLRTPLASMIGAADTVRALDDALSSEERRELLDAVISEGERLNRYIQNLLDMTRLGHGTLKLDRDWIGIDDILNSVLRRTRELLRECQLVRRIEPGLPLLYVHPALIEQALVNVIENAAKFSPKGGEVLVAVARDKSELLIAVSDEGPGIPPDQREQVFNMFFIGGEGDRGKHGSGLGLAICSGMIGAHGGRIEALPRPGGRGTTISIHLPLIEPPADDKEENA
ncbi:MAG: sensor histidine kinase KdpD [Xanthomonadales bacterium]|nr:sensor histidine kinase KdpD [Xanthomonadales bacterium]